MQQTSQQKPFVVVTKSFGQLVLASPKSFDDVTLARELAKHLTKTHGKEHFSMHYLYIDALNDESFDPASPRPEDWRDDG